MKKIIFPNIPLAKGVTIKNDTFYTYVSHENCTIPYQGWKIHISATLENYKIILEKTLHCCLDFNITIKFVNSEEGLLSIISKTASPLEIGKFITIYPENDTKFLKFLEILYYSLPKEDSVQILTDHQYKDSKIIFYRYGIMNASSISGERPPLIDNNGNEVQDIQGAYYKCPSFVKDFFSTIDREDTDDQVILNNRFLMKTIIHQSGAGNVYTAIDQTNGNTVLIKEARKLVRINEKLLAIDLLKNEAHILRKINASSVPKFIDEFTEEENYYLVEEYIIGTSLAKLKNDYNLLINRQAKESEAYTLKIKNLIQLMFTNLDRIHKQGILLEDISINNMILVDNKYLYFIDFETAYLKGSLCPIQTTQNHLPHKILATGEQRDRIKLWFTVIDLLTNVSSLLNYDPSGYSTIKAFLNFCINNNFPQKLLFKLLSDFKTEKYLDLSTLNSLIIVNSSTEFGQILNIKQQILNTILAPDSIDVDGDSLLELVDNYLSISSLGLIPTQKPNFDQLLNTEKNSIAAKLAKIELSLTSIEENIDIFYKNGCSKELNYTYKYRMLKILNDKNSYPLIFENIIDSIIEYNVEFENDILYVKLDQYLSPYLINGNSGLIIELIRFSIMNHTTEFNHLIKKLSLGIENTYAKSTTLYTGLAGLGVANLFLYKYFKNLKFLKKSISIFQNICQYSIYKNNNFLITDPLQKNINYSYSKGLIGQYYFISILSSFV